MSHPVATDPVAIASNESFFGWTKTFTDPRLCAAIVDRLTFGGHIIETGTQSYRLAATLAQQQAVLGSNRGNQGVRRRARSASVSGTSR